MKIATRAAYGQALAKLGEQYPELVVLDALFVWLKQYLHYITLLQGLFTAAMVIYLFNSSMDSSARLTWMFLIALFPLPAAAPRALALPTRRHHRMAVRLSGPAPWTLHALGFETRAGNANRR